MGLSQLSSSFASLVPGIAYLTSGPLNMLCSPARIPFPLLLPCLEPFFCYLKGVQAHNRGERNICGMNKWRSEWINERMCSLKTPPQRAQGERPVDPHSCSWSRARDVEGRVAQRGRPTHSRPHGQELAESGLEPGSPSPAPGLSPQRPGAASLFYAWHHQCFSAVWRQQKAPIQHKDSFEKLQILEKLWKPSRSYAF